jgi:hypothetical protein
MHQGVYGPSRDFVLVRILLVSQKVVSTWSLGWRALWDLKVQILYVPPSTLISLTVGLAPAVKQQIL